MRNLKIFDLNESGKTTFQNYWDTVQAVSTYIIKEEISKRNHLTNQKKKRKLNSK